MEHGSLPDDKVIEDVEDAQLDDGSDDSFYANAPQDLTLQDCLVERFKGKTIGEQRTFFERKMKEMARAGNDEADGWVVSLDCCGTEDEGELLQGIFK